MKASEDKKLIAQIEYIIGNRCDDNRDCLKCEYYKKDSDGDAYCDEPELPEQIVNLIDKFGYNKDGK
jgi:hypothetical protein